MYCSDMCLPQNGGAQYWTEHLSEIRELIDREHLDVLQVSGVSMLPPRLEGAISFDSCATKRSARDQLIVNIFI